MKDKWWNDFRASELAKQDAMAHFGFVQMSTITGRRKFATETILNPDKKWWQLWKPKFVPKGIEILKFMEDRNQYWQDNFNKQTY